MKQSIHHPMQSWQMEASLSELDRVAQEVAKKIPSHAVLFLRGDLASGKTTFVQALARQKGSCSVVTSPTFSIQQIYEGGLYHYDLYQCDTEEFWYMGLAEALEIPGWHLIEWGDEALESLVMRMGLWSAILHIAPHGEKKRLYRMVCHA